MNLLRLSFLSLKNRISLGFALICILLVIVSVVSYLGFLQTDTHFKHFAGLNDQARLHTQIVSNVIELQRQSLRYTYEGHKTAENSAYSLYNILDKDLKAARQATADKITIRILNKMTEHLGIYINTFEQVVEERKLRNNIVQKELRINVEKAEKALLEYSQYEIEEGDQEHYLRTNSIITEFLGIENSVSRYFDLLDSTHITKAMKSFDDVNVVIREFIDDEEKENRDGNNVGLHDIDYLVEARDMILAYEKALLRAVQATRGYLYLVNVVMAGEASEFLYNANKLKVISTRNMVIIQKQLAHTIQTATRLTVIVATVTIAFGIILSWLIGQSITTPIIQIANTFKLLAKGDSNSIIPGLNYKDEIGDLSRAAEVFKNKNRQTELLLIDSQALTSELEANRKELARSNDELEQFVFTVSHDLKTPLVTSMGYISMIKDLAERGEEKKAVSKLDKVVHANTRMGQLINDLLELSRVGRIEMNKQSLDMNIILKSLKSSLINKLEKENFELKLEMEFPTIYANKSRVFQVFENMMSNVFKYAKTPSGKNIVKIGSKENSGEYLFYVEDNGQGIPEGYHKKIFDLFYRLDNSEEGTGIGLAIVHKIMQFHDGRVWVESEEGHGSTFWLAFPKKAVNT